MKLQKKKKKSLVILYNNKEIKALIEKDDKFLGGEKVIFKIDNKTTAIISKNLI